MQNEFSDRQRAIKMRLAGDSIELICRALHRSEPWFNKWWRRYLEVGSEGLYDLTRARHTTVNRTPVHVERAILTIRRRLSARATPQTRYALLGAPAIVRELKQLDISPVPTFRTIERILERAHLTSPRLRWRIAFPRHNIQCRKRETRTKCIKWIWLVRVTSTAIRPNTISISAKTRSISRFT